MRRKPVIPSTSICQFQTSRLPAKKQQFTRGLNLQAATKKDVLLLSKQVASLERKLSIAQGEIFRAIKACSKRSAKYTSSTESSTAMVTKAASCPSTIYLRRSLAWNLYAKWGVQLGRHTGDQSKSLPADWSTVARIAEAFKRLSKLDSTRLAALLKQSDYRLSSLADPLQFGMSSHRWLDPQHEREESYSDWLAWSLELMNSADGVLQILGLENTRFARLVRNKQYKVSREEVCPTQKGEPKRPDLVIRFDGGYAGILLVEVKIRDLEAAGGRENLADYCRWLEKQQENPNRRYAVLLVPVQPDPDCTGWDLRLWEDVSLSLRWSALSRPKPRRGLAPGELLFNAMCLGFAGAIEQNVIGLNRAGTLLAPKTKLYLQQFLKGPDHE